MTDKVDIIPFHVARSEYLDVLAKVELQIVRILNYFDVVVGKDSLGQKLEKLRSVKNAKVDEATSKKLIRYADSLATMLDERNDIVHMRMQIVHLNAIPYALFSKQALSDTHSSLTGRLINEDQFKELKSSLHRLANSLAQIAKPPEPAKKAPANADAPIKLISANA